MYERLVGVIVRPFGLRGEMKTRLLMDDPDCLTIGRNVQMVRPDGSTRVARIRTARPHKGHLLLRVEGVDTADDAEVWRGAEVRTPGETASPLPADTYYSSDLIGMEVRHVDGSKVGVVEDVLRYPAQDLLVVGDSLIPAVAAIVRSVDTEQRLITVDPPSGLLSQTQVGQQEDAADAL